MSALSGVLKARTTQAGQIKSKTTQQGVSQTQSHDLRGNALPSSMSDLLASMAITAKSLARIALRLTAEAGRVDPAGGR